VTTPTSFARGAAIDTCVLRTSGHCGGLAADNPEESEQRDYANSDRQKIKVFSIHKPGGLLHRG
jgi:hypothetical protein